MLNALLLNALASFAKVHNLTAETFDIFIKENPNCLVKFTAPWCGHCKKLAPAFEAASNALEGRVALADVDLDAAENSALKTRFQVRGFPTIKFFEDGDVMEYDGGRSEAQIVNWVKKMTSPATSFLSGRVEVEDFKKSIPGDALIAYEGSMRPGNAEFGNFQAFCKDHRQLITCVAYTGIDGEMPVMELFRPDNTSTRKNFDFETTFEEMKAFVRGEKLEYFGSLTQDNFAMYKDSGTEVVYFVGTKKDYEAVKDTVEAVSKKTRGFYSFAHMDDRLMGKQANSMFGYSMGDGAKMYIAAPTGKKGSFHGPSGLEFSASELSTFVTDHRDGKIEIIKKSEDLPVDDSSALKTLVGLNIDEELKNAEQYMILIHAPWCGHCKKFKPEYEKFAKALEGVGSKMLVAQVDATANDFDIPGVSFTGFPTIFYKGPKGKPVKFAGDRTMQGLVEFVTKKGAADFSAEAVLGTQMASDEL